MYHEFIGRKVVREIVPADMTEFQFAAHELREPSRDLDRSDVLRDRVVRTCLRDQHPVAAFKRIDRHGALDHFGKVAKIPREQNGKRSHGYRVRRVGRHLEKRLRVRDHERGGLSKTAERFAQLAFLYHAAPCVVVKQIADRLHLRKNEPSLWRLLVDRHHEHGTLAGRHEIGHN